MRAMAGASATPMNTLAMLEKLVGFDTTSAKSNLALIDFVKEYLAGFGIPCRIIPYQDGAKANLLATIGDAANPGIIFSGHTDVVPAKPEEWQSDPFALTSRDDRVYGRGSVDMKGGPGTSLVGTILPAYDRQFTKPGRTVRHELSIHDRSARQWQM